MTTASLNYTGRKRITRKQFSVTHSVGNDAADEFVLSVWIDPKLIDKIDGADVIVLDMVNRADHERFNLKVTESQTVRPKYFLRESRPRYRLSVVQREGDTPGKIKTSSPEFRLIFPDDEVYDDEDKNRPTAELKEEKETFFNLEERDDLGAMLWKVDFSDFGCIQVLINKRLLEVYDGDQKNPMMRGFMLPAIVREIFSGIFMRAKSKEIIEGEESEKWFTWAQYIMEEPLPDVDFTEDDQISKEWLDWLDSLLIDFSERRFGGKFTLLGAMEDYISD